MAPSTCTNESRSIVCRRPSTTSSSWWRGRAGASVPWINRTAASPARRTATRATRRLRAEVRLLKPALADSALSSSLSSLTRRTMPSCVARRDRRRFVRAAGLVFTVKSKSDAMSDQIVLRIWPLLGWGCGREG